MAPATRGMGHRRRAPAIAAVVGRRSGESGADTSGLRSGLLPVPWKRESWWRHQPGIHGHIRVRQRSPLCRRQRAARPARPPIGIYRNRPATGVARVVCYSPRHDLTLAQLDVDGVEALLETWQLQMRELASASRRGLRPDLREQGRGRRRQQPAPALSNLRDQLHLQVHRDGSSGPAAGISPKPAARSSTTSSRPSVRTGAGSSPSMAAPSRSCRTSHAMPTRRTSRRSRSVATIDGLHDEERRDLATVLRDVVIRFDNLWRMPFPYVMALHQAPAEGGRRRIPLPHRIPSAAAPAEPAQVPGRSRDWRRQLPQRHVAGGEGRRAAPLPAVRTICRLRPESKHDDRAPLPPTARAYPGTASPHPRRCRPRRAKRTAVRNALRRRDARTEGDTIYAIDRVAEHELVAEIGRTIATRAGTGAAGGRGAAWRARSWCRKAPTEEAARWVIIVDPIDGTRGLMYQKRSAWILTGVAPVRGPRTLATSSSRCRRRSRSSSSICRTSSGPFAARERRRCAFNRLTGESRPLMLRPSTATTIAHGFAMIARFFPGASSRARRDRRRGRRGGAAGPSASRARRSAFEDQYISHAAASSTS